MQGVVNSHQEGVANAHTNIKGNKEQYKRGLRKMPKGTNSEGTLAYYTKSMKGSAMLRKIGGSQCKTNSQASRGISLSTSTHSSQSTNWRNCLISMEKPKDIANGV